MSGTRRRSTRGGSAKETLERRAEIAREEHADFSRVHADRQAFDAKAFEAALRHRQTMPRSPAEVFDVTRRKGRAKVGVRRDDGGVAHTRARRGSRSSGLVAEVEVTMEERAPATLVIPVDEKQTRDFHPETLEIMRWDEKSETYRPLGAGGTNIEGGYVWARITRPGDYAVIGLPLPHVLREAGKERMQLFARAMSGWQVIIVRTFVPDGPWQPLGPSNLSCCIFDVDVEPGTDRLYAAASDGGVWRLNSVSAYPHNTWRPMTDDQPSLQVNCVAVSPADGSVVFYADRSGRLFRSTNRGNTWHLRASGLGAVRRLAPHPTDSDTLYAATNGGLRCTNDGGTTWLANPGQSTLRDGDILDVVLDPDDPSIVYAAQRLTGVVKSVDAGGTWATTLAWSRANTPAGSMIKLGIGAQGTPARRTVAAKLDQEVWVTRSSGTARIRGVSAWTSKGKWGGTGYGDWCHVIAVDPFDDDVMLAGGQQLYRTPDGGGNWSLVVDYYAPHEDQHRVVFDPATSGVVYLANDGGVFRSTDGGVTWQTSGDDIAAARNLTIGLQTAQFYTAAVSGDHAIGDVYHQGLIGANWLSRLNWSGIEGHAWEFNNVAGDPVRHSMYYVFGGSLFRRTFPTGGLETIGAFAPSAIAASPDTGSAVVLAGDTSGGAWVTSNVSVATPSWSAMSGKSGGDVIVSIAFAPSNPARAYALTGTGRVFRCNNVASPGWTARTSLPGGAGTALAVSTDDDQLVFAIDATTAYRSNDGGGSWNPVPGTSPATLPPAAQFVSIAAGPGTVYVAATAAVFRSPDAGAHWFDYSDGLPNVELKELLWTDNDLFAVTHGRGLWHHGRYSETWIPPRAHIPDITWLIELWLAIHGGDPAPEIIRAQLGRGITPFVRRT